MSSSSLYLSSGPQPCISMNLLEISTRMRERSSKSMLNQDRCLPVLASLLVVSLFSVNGIIIYSVMQIRNLESSLTLPSITLIISYRYDFLRILNPSTSLHLCLPSFGPCYQLFTPGILQRLIWPCRIHSCPL